MTVGKTIEEAKIMASEALTGHIMMMLADNEQIPQPSNLESILIDENHNNAVAFILINISREVFTEQNKQVIAC